MPFPVLPPHRRRLHANIVKVFFMYGLLNFIGSLKIPFSKVKLIFVGRRGNPISKLFMKNIKNELKSFSKSQIIFTQGSIVKVMP